MTKLYIYLYFSTYLYHYGFSSQRENVDQNNTLSLVLVGG